MYARGFKLKILFLLSFIFLSSCFSNNANIRQLSFSELDLKLTEEWIFTENIEKLKYNDMEITSLPGYEQLVMELTIPQKGGLNRKTHCLYYQVSYKDKVSNLKVQELIEGGPCPIYSTKEISFIELLGINNFKISFKKFMLTMEFQYQKVKRKIEIPIPNYEEGLIHEKYQPIKEKRLFSGLKFLRLDESSFDFASNRYLGKLADRFSGGSSLRCHQVNKNCETVGENRCEQCRYGWYEVVDFQCSQGGSKFCGQNHCGEKNEPACPRGTKVVDLEDAGICQSDLSPVLNGDGILVCQ
jgi:hypothetical protein